MIQLESPVKITHPEHHGGNHDPALQPLHVMHGQLEVAVDVCFFVSVYLSSEQSHGTAKLAVGAGGPLLGAGEEVAVQLAQVSYPDTPTPRVVALDGERGDSVGCDDVVDWGQRLAADFAVSCEVGRAPAAVDAPAITLRLAGVPGHHVARLAEDLGGWWENKVLVVASNCHLC